MRRRTFLKLAGNVGVGLSTFPAKVGAEASWPNKPVKIIVAQIRARRLHAAALLELVDCSPAAPALGAL